VAHQVPHIEEALGELVAGSGAGQLHFLDQTLLEEPIQLGGHSGSGNIGQFSQSR
jgi:hypothetical protein